MDTESDTTAKPYINHLSLKALKFSELSSGTDNLDSYTSDLDSLELIYDMYIYV